MSKVWDVVIVGAGTAGIPAAIKAAQRGAKVVVIEAADRIGGTLHFSAGSMSAAGTSLQRKKGIDDSPDKHFKNAIHINHGTGNHPMMRLWMDNSADTMEWLFSIGMKYPDNQPTAVAGHEPYDAPRICTPPNAGLGYLDVLVPAFEAEVAKGGVTLRLKTEMLELVHDKAAGVRGVKVRNPDGSVEDVLGRNTVLASGGYAYNEAMWRQYHGRPRRVYCNPYSMGAGLTAALKLGATVAGAEELITTFGGTVDIDQPDKYWIHTKSMPIMRPTWEICVDLKGRRFMAEDETSPDWRERMIMAQDDWACWFVYDQHIADTSPYFFLWPRDKVERAFRTHPDYRKADTLDGLAAATGMDAKVFKAEVARYNAGQAVGSDAFGRTFMPAPIAKGPFYAVKHYGLSVVSFGGIVTDTGLRVLDGAGRPIPNLYAGGELLGMGLWGNAYLGGSSVGGCLTMGRLLGEKILSWQEKGSLAAE
ncbi:MAG: FAD-dependent oxidoreductase [Rhodospirillaceae bacterium]|nr:FAD-dependent oxidoreductase [Rhodospirillaceae bacterium]